MKLTESRKKDHVKICLTKPVEFQKSNGFDRLELVHKAAPEVNWDDIDISTRFLGKFFKAPLMISSMTGGHRGTEKINRNLAKAAEQAGIGMGVGSQRAAIENSSLAYTYKVRDQAPNIFLAGNIGAAQTLHYRKEQIMKAVEMINADALFIHLNAAQEAIQKEGDKSWEGVLKRIRELCSYFDFPIIAKETGCGITGKTARHLEMAGVSAVDVAGAGGTSWIKVEHYRGSKAAKNFVEWGIPTAISLESCARSVKIPIIASGGIRSGLEIAKAIAMGADLAGIALPFLKPAMKSADAVRKEIDRIVFELKIAMLLTGSKNLKELSNAEVIRL